MNFFPERIDKFLWRIIMKFLDKISYRYLVIFAILLGLAPFQPEPHLSEKFKMLLDNSLSKPIDIFDFLFHLAPVILLLLKLLREKRFQKL